MKKLFINLSIITSSLLVLNSCGRTFEEINTDTSKIENPTAGSFLAPLQYEMSNYGYNRADDFTFQLMQVALPFPNEGNTLSRYYLTEGTGNGYWNTSYKWLKQVKEMREFAIAENQPNYVAISMVMNAWIYSNLTDAFGDIPFSEALRLEDEIMKPKFDRQKDIYVQLLDDLKAANAMFDTTKQLSDLDLFYHGESSAANILKWKKFANSLSLRLLTRIQSRNGEVNVHARIQEIVNNPAVYPIFQNVEDGVTLNISGVAPYMPPIARPQDFTSYRAAGEFFVDALKANNDPRMSKFFSQAKALAAPSPNIGYFGAPSGYALGTVFNYQPSNMNQNLAKAPLKVLVYPYAELQFSLAELALKGVIPGSAQLYYENGVSATLEEWGNAVPADYFQNPVVAYNGTMEQIMLQKYIALFFVDHQQWYEHRRTGLPVLPNNGGLMNNGQMPQRMMYPANPKIMNTENYNAAVSAMGGDDINTKMWWNQ
ncbi:SusD/RagB family nutrient-binding outer membrane lipoprotein [Chryseobacterium sp. MFBS3-17]|uniref:SusD/RagB family nutrient-binding outer membrane lipoprotein n=1 Tax=Chryseobacterium sp. MFBS3-17 TaxID=2886689 RepID=UPI001D0E2087|nr:SusD/RagB family nutrient-binding outer membrane lipoprotein [Chryseobacterium sp. MFBS3-17]MCC2590277.1 SusD/RagB family nutrient-binding outer membrane lipoprotein [Chryseobacterium sp. MFBS3-17]